MPLNGKVALITGASTIPGSNIAVALAREGVKVAVEGVAGVQERVLRTVETFRGNALPVRGNIADESDVNHMLSNVTAIMGHVDILINASGLSLNKTIEDTSIEEFDKIMSSRVRAAFLCSKAVIPGMKERGTGHIITIGPPQRKRIGGNQIAVCASEDALIGFSHSLAQEMCGTAIRVSTIFPESSTDHENPHMYGGIDPEEVAQGVILLINQSGTSARTRLFLQS